MSQSAMRDALLTLDVGKAKAVWAFKAPHLPMGTDEQALVSLHMARTAAKFLPFKLRAYSHAWLLERNHMSLMPDSLRPKAQRIHPVVASAVGIAVKASRPEFGKAALEIRTSMEHAVLEAEADGKLLDSVHVKARIDAARRRTIDKLFG